MALFLNLSHKYTTVFLKLFEVGYFYCTEVLCFLYTKKPITNQSMVLPLYS
jgi:hypothetical protein